MARRVSDKGPASPLSLVQVVLLVFLLVLPTSAVFHITFVKIDSLKVMGVVFSYLVFGSLASYIQLRSDKLKAQSRQWRIPENRLHIFELLGGWPGSFIAQRRFRHKVAKSSYQLVFWLIVIVYQLVALNYLLDGALLAQVAGSI